jgi:ribonuclease VapC
VSDVGYVLDASALTALLLDEPGADKVRDLIPFSVIGAVNLSEVVAKLQERGVPDEDVDLTLAELDLDVIAFDARHALTAGRLRQNTRAAGLSFGDRACLALAQTLSAIALTADRAWERLPESLAIEMVR